AKLVRFIMFIDYPSSLSKGSLLSESPTALEASDYTWILRTFAVSGSLGYRNGQPIFCARAEPAYNN
ncbi:hypothetical protein ABFV62_31410, partial [Pseudomonas syringae]|uniref:hypothetical protein n=1 Tax=Pseudomonas syringae TaxID=317 RepID=UPI0034D74BA0